jgi:hypothetical protein
MAKQKEPARRKSGPHKSTKAFVADWYDIYPREKYFLRRSPTTFAKWIKELEENLRQGKTQFGKAISENEAEAIREYIKDLKQRHDDLIAGKIKQPRIGEVRDRLADRFVESGIYGRPRGGQDNRTFIDEKLKRARRRLRRASKK